MRMITAAAAAMVAAIALAGCGGDDSSGAAAAGDGATTPAATLTLKEICPEVEAALPGAFPRSPALQRFADRLDELAGQGDTEARNALELLQQPTAAYVKVADGQGQEIVDADQTFLQGLDAFANRCKAAGSSALQ